MICSDGVELAVWEEGPRDAPALIFLHGFPENHRAWRHQVAHFSGRYRCIAPDLRGYGASGKPEGREAYATPRLVRDCLELAQGLERFTLVGHDWGGVLAWYAAQDARVERLVIANAPHPARFAQVLASDPAQRAASAYIARLAQAEVDERGLGPVLARNFDGRAMAGMEREELALLTRQWADPAGARAMLHWYGAQDLGPIGVVRVPVLVIWGEEDAALMPANARGLEAFAPDVRLCSLPGVGHFSPWSAPDAVCAAMEAFFRSA